MDLGSREILVSIRNLVDRFSNDAAHIEILLQHPVPLKVRLFANLAWVWNFFLMIHTNMQIYALSFIYFMTKQPQLFIKIDIYDTVKQLDFTAICSSGTFSVQTIFLQISKT